MHYNLDSIGENLAEAMSDTFENLMFADVENYKNVSEIKCNEASVWIEVDTLIPFTGSVVIIMGQAISYSLVEEMLGGEMENVDDDMVLDALKEVGNTVVGRFLSQIVPENEEFTLGFPTYRELAVGELTKMDKSYQRYYALDVNNEPIYCLLNKFGSGDNNIVNRQ